MDDLERASHSFLACAAYKPMAGLYSLLFILKVNLPGLPSKSCFPSVFFWVGFKGQWANRGA